MELIFVTRAVACCSPAGGHSWPSFFLYFFLFFLFTAYTTSPVLIGRPEATLSKATGCAVYQLTSAYRTKEQMSGWWASASLPSEFFFKKQKKQKQLHRCWEKSYLLKGDNCIVGSIGCAEPRGRFLSGDTFHTELAFWRSRLLTTTTQRNIRAQVDLFRDIRGCYRRPRKAPPPFSFFAGIWKRCLCKISPVPNRKAPRRTVHTCSLQVWTKAHRWKFMCPWLGQARRSSMQVSMLLVFYPLPRL